MGWWTASVRVGEQSRAVGARAGKPPLQAALALIEHRFDQSLPVAALARSVGCPASRLHALFSAHLGETPLAALTARRLSHARGLLVHQPDLAVAEVGRQSGFANAVHFSRIFRQHHRRRHACGAVP